MQTEFETIDCPLCGHEKFELRLTAPDRFNLEDGEPFQIVACCKCGFVFLNPRPDATGIGQYYESAEYQPFLSAKKARSLGDRLYDLVRVFTVRRKRRVIERCKDRGLLLDVGCGTGEFLHEMKTHGWQVAGVEKDPAAAQFAEQKFGVAVETRDLSECEFSDGSFDAITLWHVLEHVHDPRAFLTTIGRLMKADGILLVAVPNIGSLDARFYERHWVALDTPRHLSHFTFRSMQELGLESGFCLAGARQMVLDAFYNCLLSEQIILKRKMTRGSLALLHLLRAGCVATASVCKASRISSAAGACLGSSVLYTMKKAEQ
ncbi:MAG: class I SAM-dependent methyltransferase [Calditrichaeota bacterium]|nr:class I SAM-dependent methyltransferase [Calditrichota bacterium]